MQVVVLLLLVAGLAFLVLGLITASTPLVLASLVASVLAGLTIARYRRGLADGAGASSRPAAEERDRSVRTPVRVPELVASVAAAPAQGAVPPAHAADEPAHGAEPAPAAASAHAADEPAHAADEPAHAVDEPSRAAPDDDEPAAADTDPPLRSRGDEPVWVIDGRPRYHLPRCAFLLAQAPESVPLRQAVEDGFTPCALCDPDTGLTLGSVTG